MLSFIAFSAPKTTGIQFRASYLKDCVCTALGSVKIMTFRCFLTGGTANQVHLLMALPATIALAKEVQILKVNSSRCIRTHGLEFAWREGYGAFSVSPSNLGAVKQYTEHQREHHGNTHSRMSSFRFCVSRVCPMIRNLFLAEYRPCGTRISEGSVPGTSVPGFHMPPLRGWSILPVRLLGAR
jgi:REP element-mobilizing transposase RayT